MFMRDPKPVQQSKWKNALSIQRNNIATEKNQNNKMPTSIWKSPDDSKTETNLHTD